MHLSRLREVDQPYCSLLLFNIIANSFTVLKSDCFKLQSETKHKALDLCTFWLQIPALTCGHERLCVMFTNSGWRPCDYTSTRVSTNGSFYAVSQTDCSDPNPFLNPVCHTKTNCGPSYQFKHINAALYTVITSQVKEVVLSQHSYHMSHTLKTGWI